MRVRVFIGIMLSQGLGLTNKKYEGVFTPYILVPENGRK